MSRGGRDDSRDDARTPALDDARRKGPDGTAGVPLDRLTLRPGHAREPVVHRGRTYFLRDTDVRTLATIGTFRVVRAGEIQTLRSSRDAWKGDLGHLRTQALIEVQNVSINRQVTPVAVLTERGKSLLDAYTDRVSGRGQAYHAGLVKPRELAHDAQAYALFQAEAARIEADGGRVTRVLLDYELKRDYQTFLNRHRLPDADDAEPVAWFAATHDLPVVDGHLELPDLRIEYETIDGELRHRDVELVTEHYSRAQLAGKARAGFSMYRAAGARLHGGSTRTGGTPLDPHQLEWLG